MPYVLYGLRLCGCQRERTKVATFSQKFLAEHYVYCVETSESKNRQHYGFLDRKYYKWSLLGDFFGHEVLWEDNDEVPHDPWPTKEQKI
jgi:hypothetical protein